MRHAHQGISLLSILIAIAIIGTASVIGMQVFSQYLLQQDLLSDAGQVVSMLRTAREQTVASENRSQYGVHITATGTELFKGASYGAGSIESTYIFSSRISATTTFGGDIVFLRLTGEASTTGDVTIFGNTSTTTNRTVSINETGLISIQ